MNSLHVLLGLLVIGGCSEATDPLAKRPSDSEPAKAIPTSNVSGPEPTLEQLEAHDRALHTTDLSIGLTSQAVDGGVQVLATVANRGNPVYAAVALALPTGIAMSVGDGDCLGDAGAECVLNYIESGKTRSARFLLRADSPDAGAVSANITGTVKNLTGDDSAPTNNTASIRVTLGSP
jgi:hypothetical protein